MFQKPWFGVDSGKVGKIFKISTNIWLIHGLSSIHPGNSPKSLNNQEVRMEGNNSFNMLAFQALKRASRKVREKARRNKLKIPYWIDGETHWMVPKPGEDSEEEMSDRGTEDTHFIYDEKFD
jgi:hypothetical protein